MRLPLILCLLGLCTCTLGQKAPLAGNSSISLNVGVTGGAPYVFSPEKSDQWKSSNSSAQLQTNLSGFHVDLLAVLQDIAWREDRVNLTFNIMRSPLRSAGLSLNLLSRDCYNSTDAQDGKYNATQCGTVDLLACSLFITPDRASRVDFAPVILQDYVTATRYISGSGLATFESVQASNGTVCVRAGMFKDRDRRIHQLYPDLNLKLCTDCYSNLKEGQCDLYAERALYGIYSALNDKDLITTQEKIDFGFVAWPIRYNLANPVKSLINKWFYIAIAESEVEILYNKYLTFPLCPLGYAGPTCQEHCDPSHGRSNEEGICICASTRYEGADCSQEVLHDAQLIPSYQLYIGYCLFGINAVVVLASALWLYRNRAQQHVILAQPPLLSLILMGCLISSSAILALMQQAQPGDTVHHCMLIPWLYSVGFCVTFGTLFARIYRVHTLMRHASQMRRVKVTVLSALRWIALVLVVDMAILTTWQAVDAMYWGREITLEDKFGITLKSIGTCQSEHWRWFAGAIGAFHLFLLVVASVMIYVSRKVPDEMSGAHGAKVAMVMNLQTFLIGLPLLLLVRTDPNSSFFLRSAIIWINDLVVVVVVMGELIFRKPDARLPGEMIRSTVRKIRESDAKTRESDATRNMTCFKSETTTRNSTGIGEGSTNLFSSLQRDDAQLESKQEL